MGKTGQARRGVANSRDRRATASRTWRTTLGRRVAAPAAALALLAARAAAQDTTRALPPDSLLARLERAEEAIGLLRQQLATQAQSGVQTRTRVRLEFDGLVLLTGFWNRGRVNNTDVPTFVAPRMATLSDEENERLERSAGAVVRQTMLGLAVSGARAGGADVSGDVELDFAGGPNSGPAHGTFPQPRLRIGRIFARWAAAELMIGQEVPLIAGENPVSVSAISTPEFANAGNLWLWLPQVRATKEFGTGVRLGLQGAVLAPNAGESFDGDAVDAAERSRRPYLQTRVRLRWGEEGDDGGEIGVGAHQGWLVHPNSDDRLSSEAVAADARVPLVGGLEVRGEWYRGRLLRGLGGGGIGQNLGLAGTTPRQVPITDQGGWVQLNLRSAAGHVVGAGCGIDDPENDDGPARRRNQVCEGHVIWRPGGGWLLGAEFKRLRTDYQGANRYASHANLALGLEF